ncbi:MAG TPA: lanthionine synthetase LanC family protein [Thermoanaerobaculia bacterium]
MMSEWRLPVEAVIQATTIRSPTSYSWLGRRSPAAARRLGPNVGADLAREYLLVTLTSHLYFNFYCHGWPRAMGPAVNRPRAPGGDPAFVRGLSKANRGDGHWQEGWEIRALDTNAVRVARGGLELLARPGDLAVTAEAVRVGEAVGLWFPKDSFSLSPGYYTATGDEPWREQPSGGVVRLYWDVTSAGAAVLVESLTSGLNRSRVPFSLKIVNYPDGFQRCDAGVLYLAKADVATAETDVRRAYERVAALLDPGRPAFTKALARGLSLAEDPGNGESFGLHRSRLLAEAIIDAHEQRAGTLGARMGVVLRHFAEEGIDFAAPHRRKDSAEGYPLSIPPPVGYPGLPLLIRRIATRTDGAPSSETTQSIGRRIVREAVWHGGRCTWIGLRQTREGRPAYGALDADVYAGTSGVAVFLAELFAAFQEPEVGRTARGAIRQALSAAAQRAGASGLYDGWPGVALAAARVGLCLGEDEFIGRSHDLARRLASAALTDSRGFDLARGRAGAVIASLVLHAQTEDGWFLDWALRLGDDLLATAEQSDGTWSWRGSDGVRWANLTGLSHGTAGVALALSELAFASGERRFLDVGAGALAYERGWFDSDAGNWRDLRYEPSGAGQGRGPKRFATHWCHGAPGIALSRLRIYELFGDDGIRREAEVALSATRAPLASASWPGRDFSLCHGLAGNADILLEGVRVLGKDGDLSASLPQALAEFGARQYLTEDGGSWPCGSGSGEMPGLMTGLAGIGHFYLRLHDPDIDSVLLWRPQRTRSPGH